MTNEVGHYDHQTRTYTAHPNFERDIFSWRRLRLFAIAANQDIVAKALLSGKIATDAEGAERMSRKMDGKLPILSSPVSRSPRHPLFVESCFATMYNAQILALD